MMHCLSLLRHSRILFFCLAVVTTCTLAAYQQYAARRDQQEAALRRLYDQARAALPELRPALEQKMRQMPQPKSAPVSTRAPIPIPIPVIEIPE